MGVHLRFEIKVCAFNKNIIRQHHGYRIVMKLYLFLKKKKFHHSRQNMCCMGALFS